MDEEPSASEVRAAVETAIAKLPFPDVSTEALSQHMTVGDPIPTIKPCSNAPRGALWSVFVDLGDEDTSQIRLKAFLGRGSGESNPTWSVISYRFLSLVARSDSELRGDHLLIWAVAKDKKFEDQPNLERKFLSKADSRKVDLHRPHIVDWADLHQTGVLYPFEGKEFAENDGLLLAIDGNILEQGEVYFFNEATEKISDHLTSKNNSQ